MAKKHMSNLLIEVTTEDMPAQGQIEQGLKFCTIMVKNLELKPDAIQLLISPRHLCLFVDNLKLQDKISIKGPKISAEDSAILGFMNRYGVEKREDLFIRDACYFYENLLDEEAQYQLLTQKIEKSFVEMVWPRSMIWGQNRTKWVRPIKSLMVFFDQKLLPVIYGSIKSCNYTIVNEEKLHFQMADFNLYLHNLKEKQVIVSHLEREKIIVEAIHNLLAPLQLQVIEDVKLLEELVSLVENPQIYLGRIEEEFLQLPREILLTSLGKNQKYLLVEDAAKNIAPFFIIVANIKAQDGGKKLIAGHEKVLKARLKDAAFFIQEDQKYNFKEQLTDLNRIIFYEKLGTMSDKVARIKNLVMQICHELHISPLKIEKAAEICKNDLITNLVGEFPELQGFTGYYYSKLQGLEDEITLAIRDHYKPIGVNDSLPTTLNGAILAIADKIDHLMSFFGIGIKPTATKDPYALRRAALGILRIKKAFNLQLRFESFINQELLKFMTERAKQANLQL